MKALLIFIMLISTSLVTASDWRYGKIGILAIGYDGETISVGQEGFTRKDCTCYPTWPTRYCLDSSRKTFDKEYAFLLSTKARNKSVAIKIDEASCNVRGLYVVVK